jgi:D-arabinose 1-dehydrogenase-like Zn-dependent alcohol dehydrogenase
MRSVVSAGSGLPWSVLERTRSRPGPTELVVKVLASGVCYMDVRQSRGEMGDEGRIPGHEFVGEVVAVGREARGFQIGDILGTTWHQRWCGSCTHCVRGRVELCRAADETGIYADGGHAEYATIEAGAAVRIDPALDPAVAATLMCSGYVAYSALVDARVTPGERVLVIGMGGIGHLTVQYARSFGAEAGVLTTTPGKVSDAKRLGAAEVTVVEPEHMGSAVAGLSPADVVIMTSDAPGALMTGVHALAPYGRLVVTAAPVDPVPLVLQRLLHYKLQIIGASQGPRNRLDEMLRIHRASAAETLVERFPLDQAPAVVAAVAERRVRYRAVLVP